MRELLAAALAIAIPLAGTFAPFRHLHPGEHDTEHHRGPAAHAHVAPHAHAAAHAAGHAAVPPGPAVHETDPDRAVPLQLIVAVPQSGLTVAPALPPHVVVPVPPERPAHLSVTVVHGHDPPLVSRSAPRAPPALLS